MNLDDLTLFYCACQKVMTMSVVVVQPKKHANTCYKATKRIKRTFVISDYY